MSWALMTVFGGLCMWAMRYTPGRVDKILVRVAGFAFVGAGLMTASGWLGNTITAFVVWVTGVFDRIGVAAFGTGMMWIVSAGAGLLWLGAMLPDRLFRYDPPDWLVIGGLVIPALLVSVPGSLGEFLRTVITWAGNFMTSGVAGAVS